MDANPLHKIVAFGEPSPVGISNPVPVLYVVSRVVPVAEPWSVPLVIS